MKQMKCPICFKQFNQPSKDSMIPIRMEYNDVICSKCLSSFKLEGRKPSISANRLLKENDEFYCNAHPNRVLQYYCETDQVALCSICNIDSSHVKSNHIVTQFNPKRKLMVSEVNGIAKSIEEEIKCVIRESSSSNVIRDSLIANHKEQLRILTGATEKAMMNIFRQKMTMQSQLNQYYKNKVEEIDCLIKANKEIEGQLKQCKGQCNDLKEKYNNDTMILVYNDIDKIKKAMITDWEHSRLSIRKNRITTTKMIKDNQMQKAIKVMNDYNNKVFFEIIDQEGVSMPVLVTKVRRRSESIGSIKITSDSNTKDEHTTITQNNNTKAKAKVNAQIKRISNPNVHPIIFKLMPQLRQSQSQRVIT